MHEFKDHQILFNVRTNWLLKSSSTLWLSLEIVVKRVLENWDPLLEYFRGYEVDGEET